MENLLVIGISNALMAAILAVIAFGITRFYRHPPLAYWLWFLVLVKLVTPPILPIPASLHLSSLNVPPAPPGGELMTPEGLDGADGADGTVNGGAALPVSGIVMEFAESMEAPGREYPLGAVPILFSLWMAGTLLWLSLAAVRVLKFDRVARHAREAPASLRRLTEELSGKFGLPAPPRVLLVTGRMSPMVWSLGRRQRLLLPASLLQLLTERQKETLIAHELAHLRRRDICMRWVELTVLALHWWNPVAWWAFREIRQAEEHCCDAWVQWAFPERTREYARALLRTVDFLSTSQSALPQLASGLGQANLLKRRFQMILKQRMVRNLSWTFRIALLAVGLIVIPWAPEIAMGQNPEGGEEKPKEQDRVPLLGDIPVMGELFRSHPGDQAGRGAQEAQQMEDPFGEGPSGSEGRLDRRMRRLELQLEKMMAELKSLQSEMVTKKPKTPGSLQIPGPVLKVGNRTYLLDARSGTIQAVDSALGKLLWKTTVGKGFHPSVIQVVGDRLILGDSGDSAGKQNRRVVIDTEKGRILAMAAPPPPMPAQSFQMDQLRKTADTLKAEKASLLRRLAEIEAEELKIRDILDQLDAEAQVEKSSKKLQSPEF